MTPKIHEIPDESDLTLFKKVLIAEIEDFLAYLKQLAAEIELLKSWNWGDAEISRVLGFLTAAEVRRIIHTASKVYASFPPFRDYPPGLAI